MSCQDVVIQCDRGYQKKQDQKKKIDKILSNKDKEINHLKNHIQVLLKKIKKLKRKDIKISKVDKATQTDPVESKKFSKAAFSNNGTSIEGIKTQN